MSRSWEDILRPFRSRKRQIEFLANEFEELRKTLDHNSNEQRDAIERLTNELKALTKAQTEAVRQWHESSTDTLGHELRLLNHKANSFFEPRLPEGLFRALQEKSLQKTLRSWKTRCPMLYT